MQSYEEKFEDTKVVKQINNRKYHHWPEKHYAYH